MACAWLWLLQPGKVIKAVYSTLLIVFFWVLVIELFTDNAVPGWASILVPLLFIGSVQLLSIGVIGEYLGKLYEEVKARPRYHIDQRIEGSAQVEQPQPLEGS